MCLVLECAFPLSRRGKENQGALEGANVSMNPAASLGRRTALTLLGTEIPGRQALDTRRSNRGPSPVADRPLRSSRKL